MGAWLKGNINCRASYIFTVIIRVINGFDFGVGISVFPVPAFADNASVLNDYAAHHRIRGCHSQTVYSESQSAFHVFSVYDDYLRENFLPVFYHVTLWENLLRVFRILGVSLTIIFQEASFYFECKKIFSHRLYRHHHIHFISSFSKPSAQKLLRHYHSRRRHRWNFSRNSGR